MQGVLDQLKNWQTEMMADIQAIVELESPSGDQASLNQVADFIRDRFQTIGAEIETLPNPDPSLSDHVLVKMTFGHSDLKTTLPPKRIMLIGHFDTVHEKGSFTPVFRQEEDLAFGPGVFDMKTGIIMSLYGLRALQQLDVKANLEIVGLFTTDEEVGSVTSRTYIESIAKTCDAVLVLEPAAGNGLVKTSRKGVGEYEITAYGKAAHAGLDHQNGVNAIIELSNQMIQVQNLTNYELGTTVSVGIVSGGSRSNVVPDQATAIVDVRVATLEEAERIDREIHGLLPVSAGARLEIKGGMNRPPMERTEGVAKLFDLAKQVADTMGVDLQEIGVGGGSDGNFTAGLGIPTLDGLGPIGNGAHTLHEHIHVPSLPERVALVVGLIQKISE